MKKRVFITRTLINDGPELLRKHGLVVEMNHSEMPLSYTELCQRAQGYDALITSLEDKIDENFLRQNQQLKAIANYAVGFNNIDIETAQNLHIRVGNTPDVLTEATAELAFGLMLSAARNISTSQSEARDGFWKCWAPTGYLGHGLQNKTLGIIGMGRIGRRLAEMAEKAFQYENSLHKQKRRSSGSTTQ